jgi:glycosyltransferase 2 family protein
MIVVNDIKELKPFWDAANLGYLGNLIYPARAGEILRIVALKKFIPISEGFAISSSVIDRLADGIMIPLFLVILIEYFGRIVDIPFPVRLFALVFVIISLIVGFFIIWGKCLEEKMITWISWLPRTWIEKISLWYAQAHEGASTIKNPHRLCGVFSLSILSFFSDSLAYYTLFLAFGWVMPFTAALLICIFIFAGSTLPSTPGYFGIYQIACILAFHPFGISDTASVAYSLVLQCIVYAIFLIIGGWIMYTRRISFNILKSI